jgi:hypothetical protein
MRHMVLMENITKLPSGGDWTGSFEGAWLQEYFSGLKDIIGGAFERWTFHVLHHNCELEPVSLRHHGKGHVLIWLGDESSSPGEDVAGKFEHVFKSYALPEHRPPNVHPLPLFGSAAVLSETGLPFEQRRTQVFFSGNLNRNRAGLFWRFMFPAIDNVRMPSPSIRVRRFFSMLTKAAARFVHPTPTLPSSCISFNRGFRTGLSESEYAHQLADTMVCLCPPGFITNETIRHFEAMSMGCVVVSKRLPPSCYYDESPIIQIDDWQGILARLRNLLQDSSNLKAVSMATRSWWREHCSPSAAAIQTAGILRASR